MPKVALPKSEKNPQRRSLLLLFAGAPPEAPAGGGFPVFIPGLTTEWPPADQVLLKLMADDPDAAFDRDIEELEFLGVL